MPCAEKPVLSKMRICGIVLWAWQDNADEHIGQMGTSVAR